MDLVIYSCNGFFVSELKILYFFEDGYFELLIELEFGFVDLSGYIVCVKIYF